MPPRVAPSPFRLNDLPTEILFIVLKEVINFEEDDLKQQALKIKLSLNREWRSCLLEKNKFIWRGQNVQGYLTLINNLKQDKSRAALVREIRFTLGDRELRKLLNEFLTICTGIERVNGYFFDSKGSRENSVSYLNTVAKLNLTKFVFELKKDSSGPLFDALSKWNDTLKVLNINVADSESLVELDSYNICPTLEDLLFVTNYFSGSSIQFFKKLTTNSKNLKKLILSASVFDIKPEEIGIISNAIRNLEELYFSTTPISTDLAQIFQIPNSIKKIYIRDIKNLEDFHFFSNLPNLEYVSLTFTQNLMVRDFNAIENQIQSHTFSKYIVIDIKLFGARQTTPAQNRNLFKMGPSKGIKVNLMIW